MRSTSDRDIPNRRQRRRHLQWDPKPRRANRHGATVVTDEELRLRLIAKGLIKNQTAAGANRGCQTKEGSV